MQDPMNCGTIPKTNSKDCPSNTSHSSGVRQKKEFGANPSAHYFDNGVADKCRGSTDDHAIDSDG